MIPRLDIDLPEHGAYDYRVTYESETLFEDTGFNSVAHCLVAAVEGLSSEAVAPAAFIFDMLDGRIARRCDPHF